MRVFLGLCAVVLSAGAAFAQASYQEERSACMQFSDPDERKTCLREAGAARIEARKGGLVGEASDSAEYQKNLTARCNYLPAGDREDCERRMRGEGTTSGSVAGGGIYRELRTIVPVPEGTDAGAGATK
jgi:hypothetical protein